MRSIFGIVVGGGDLNSKGENAINDETGARKKGHKKTLKIPHYG